MAKKACPIIAERNKEMARLYTEEQLSIQKISEIYQRSPKAIHRILKTQGVKLDGRRSARQWNTDPISKISDRIGREISITRQLSLDMTRPQLAAATGISHSRLTRIERGVVDIGINELERITAALGTDVQSLLEFKKTVHRI